MPKSAKGLQPAWSSELRPTYWKGNKVGKRGGVELMVAHGKQDEVLSPPPPRFVCASVGGAIQARPASIQDCPGASAIRTREHLSHFQQDLLTL
eukprot:3444354-Rhodomonas_salina.5